MHSAISYYAENVSFSLKNKKNITSWLLEVVRLEGKKAKGVTYIFCDDPYLFELNKKYLNHNTLTDTITFDYCEDIFISGDIFISIDRVRENASKYLNSFDSELYRVICHGMLHLLGYSDKTTPKRLGMTAKEKTYLILLDKRTKSST